MADEASEQVRDGRPKGWTETLCLTYIGTEEPAEPDLIAALFIYGDWHSIHKHFPHFVHWMNERSN